MMVAVIKSNELTNKKNIHDEAHKDTHERSSRHDACKILKEY